MSDECIQSASDNFDERYTEWPYLCMDGESDCIQAGDADTNQLSDENTCVYVVTIKQGDETIETFDAVIISESEECECASEVVKSVKFSMCSGQNTGHVKVEFAETTFIHPISGVTSENEYTAQIALEGPSIIIPTSEEFFEEFRPLPAGGLEDAGTVETGNAVHVRFTGEPGEQAEVKLNNVSFTVYNDNGSYVFGYGTDDAHTFTYEGEKITRVVDEVSYEISFDGFGSSYITIGIPDPDHMTMCLATEPWDQSKTYSHMGFMHGKQYYVMDEARNVLGDAIMDCINAGHHTSIAANIWGVSTTCCHDKNRTCHYMNFSLIGHPAGTKTLWMYYPDANPHKPDTLDKAYFTMSSAKHITGTTGIYDSGPSTSRRKEHKWVANGVGCHDTTPPGCPVHDTVVYLEESLNEEMASLTGDPHAIWTPTKPPWGWNQQCVEDWSVTANDPYANSTGGCHRGTVINGRDNPFDGGVFKNFDGNEHDQTMTYYVGDIVMFNVFVSSTSMSDENVKHFEIDGIEPCMPNDPFLLNPDGSVDYVYTFSTPGTYCARAVSSAFTSSPPNEYPGEMYFGIKVIDPDGPICVSNDSVLSGTYEMTGTSTITVGHTQETRRSYTTNSTHTNVGGTGEIKLHWTPGVDSTQSPPRWTFEYVDSWSGASSVIYSDMGDWAFPWEANWDGAVDVHPWSCPGLNAKNDILINEWKCPCGDTFELACDQKQGDNWYWD